VKLRRALYIVLGCVGLFMGTVGAIMPLLPAFPFLLLAAFSFARSDPRLHTWFINTKLYKYNFEGFMQGHGMPRLAKARVVATITIVMTAGVCFMLAIPWGQALLEIIWAGHMLLFLFVIRTAPDLPKE
jgi:uncharacterized membrane protein YbaN (DUF454 family)